MTIRTVRPDRGRHFQPRTHCFKQLEAVVVEMQDPKSGVQGSEQQLHAGSIPHVITGLDVLTWVSNKMKSSPEEAQAFGTMLLAYGYVYPLQNHKKLQMSSDSSLYRFQVSLKKRNGALERGSFHWSIRVELQRGEGGVREERGGVREERGGAHYSHLHDWLNHKWDFIVMQATEQFR
ncbi:Regulator of G-protein signaling 9 [Liparis tanakae]|uniref:Regulator of G-protein signaling 9 n=1 Tax=Liparis tanakae TaxID=230148 RepID=A0A4Z2EK82_9TELE|nr:Regulator of G-protein signaling 9 [Liparis tanakae]